ncbi:MAG TPA: vWA domain-containing protein [Candidatus Brocadiia bacterium]|nr:vWA domain-containing protein [Candidatus Brocadiia bacterium]
MTRYAAEIRMIAAATAGAVSLLLLILHNRRRERLLYQVFDARRDPCLKALLKRRPFAAICVSLAILILTHVTLTSVSGNNVRASARRVWFCLDVSRSMQEQETGKPYLEASRTAISRWIDCNHCDVAALITFAGSATLYCPPTDDHRAFKSFLDAADGSTVALGGTALAPPLQLAARKVAQERSARRGDMVVLISDGDETVETFEAAVKSIRDLRKLGVAVTIAGIGTETKKLGKLAAAAGTPLIGIGDFSRFAEADAEHYAEGGTYAPLATIAAFILTALAWLLDSGRMKKVVAAGKPYRADFIEWVPMEQPTVKNSASLSTVPILITAMLAGPVMLAGCLEERNAKALSQKGNNFLKSGHAREAVMAYSEALKILDGRSVHEADLIRARLNLNCALALAKAGNFKESERRLSVLMTCKDSEVAADAHYLFGWIAAQGCLSGNSITTGRDRREAMRLFRESLRIQPGREDAVWNYCILNRISGPAPDGEPCGVAESSTPSSGEGPGNSAQTEGKEGVVSNTAMKEAGSAQSAIAETTTDGNIRSDNPDNLELSPSRAEEILKAAEDAEGEARAYMKTRGMQLAGKIEKDW